MVDSTLAPGILRHGLRIYAIGDIHGCLDRLVSLHWAINADLAHRPVAESVLIHLGDYVDRGTDSAGVVWLLTGEVAPQVTRRVDLMGNHEIMMMEALTGENSRAAESWLDNGGTTTLESYNVPVGTPTAEWAKSVPLQHRQWLKNRELLHMEDGYLFVHAGIRPGRAISKQRPEDLLWIRDPFLNSQDQHQLVVVHGHTPRSEPDVHPNRIGIDTGAVMGGKLTCVVLEDDRMGFLTA